MSDRIETVEKVRLKLWEALDGKGKKDPRVVAQVAQVEATLLLVEQQRIANQLSYLRMVSGLWGPASEPDGEFVAAADAIRAEVGL